MSFPSCPAQHFSLPACPELSHMVAPSHKGSGKCSVLFFDCRRDLRAGSWQSLSEKHMKSTIPIHSPITNPDSFLVWKTTAISDIVYNHLSNQLYKNTDFFLTFFTFYILSCKLHFYDTSWMTFIDRILDLYHFASCNIQ